MPNFVDIMKQNQVNHYQGGPGVLGFLLLNYVFTYFLETPKNDREEYIFTLVSHRYLYLINILQMYIIFPYFYLTQLLPFQC